MNAKRLVMGAGLLAGAPTAALAHAGAHEHMSASELIAHLGGLWHLGGVALAAVLLAGAGYLLLKRGTRDRARVPARRERQR